MKTDLSTYNNSWYKPGGKLKILCWYFINVLFFINPLNPISSIKVLLLKCFGAKIGTGVVLKPGVNIKYPWLLTVGDYSWIGEKVWIDNLANVIIGKHVCISQEAMLLCGNHNYKKSTFDLMVNEIIIEDGAWVGAKCVVCPGVKIESQAILTVGSVATTKLDANYIYQGNPAQQIRKRNII
ncbi:WcaF family extracellular polysaccharide biosynthesis acetyltransferase [Formosa sp. PL04]|uniref:WcaF family extracellular polysaccharide biosynthesis acetyltransferase n=1 Tax=Formosa sp. PL04 TaxID=3081755 RepID=UPI002981FCCC|nr:WcaF family extracellular polysaccharide biosynthesis acetyltransferase [Formosa sp. PL04]MDW5287863.1 WcaF family extracellular polysaccharide biosynthesis acetyltransferase [Formosa sp. PL04]